MKKILALLLCLLLLPAFSLAEEDKTLNLLSWEGYVDDTVIAAFEQETGIHVVYSPMDSIDSMLLKLSQSQGGDYDLVLSSDYSLAILREQGLLQKLDLSKFSNYGNLDENYLGQFYDPNNEYVIPYMAGSPLIVYDREAVGFEITSYEDLWDERLRDSEVLLDNPRVVIGITLKTLGQSFNTTDLDILNQAKEKLFKLYPNVRVFDDNTPDVPMVNGECIVGFMYTPHVCNVLAQRPELSVVYPKEGVGFGVDGFVMPVKAAHVDNAHIFLDYLMRPDVAAHNAETQLYQCVNKAAKEYLSEEFVNNPAIYVPEDALGNTEYIQDVGETESVFTDIYTEFKLQ